jgi:hypothetical protein
MSARISTLKLYIEDYSNNCIQKLDKNKQRTTKSLKLMINEHQSILELTRKIDNIFSLIVEAQFTFGNITIGVAGYAFITVSHCLRYTYYLKEKSEFLFMQFQVSESSRELLPKSIILVFIIVAQLFFFGCIGEYFTKHVFIIYSFCISLILNDIS